MSAEEKKPSLVDLARQALEEEARLKKAKEKVDQQSIYDHIPEGVKEKMAWVRNARSAFNAASEGVKSVLEYAGPVGRALLTLGRWSKDAAEFAMFEREDGEFKREEDGGRIFSGKRLATSFALAAGVGIAATLGVQATYYYGTQFSETVYTTGKQEIVEGELYHVTACTSLPCSTESDNGKYYQIERSMYWPRQIYPEENVYANIPQQIAACEIEGYGIYSKELRWLFKWAEWYQNIESVSCRPLSEGEIQGMMVTPPASSLNP